MKNSQRGFGVGAVLALVFGLIVFLGIVFAGMAISAYNQFITLENGIKAADRSRQTVLSNAGQKVKEAIGVRELNVKDIQDTVNAQIQNRAGKDGMKNMVLMLKEHNVSVDPAIYTKIINIIDISRTEFVREEKMLIDRKQMACNVAQRFPNSIVLGMLGKPSIHFGCGDDTDDFKQLMSESAAESFRTGIDKGLL